MHIGWQNSQNIYKTNEYEKEENISDGHELPK